MQRGGGRGCSWYWSGGNRAARGSEGQDSVEHSHYFTANEERGGHLPVARVPRVDANMGRVR